MSFDYVPPGGGGGATGSGGASGGDAGPIALSCDNAMTVLSTNCFGCHTTGAGPGFANLDLMSAGVAQRLVGVAASSAGMCLAQGNLLNHGTLPATGILLDKINFRQACGGSMPFGAPTPLAAADLACLQAWANGLVNSVP